MSRDFPAALKRAVQNITVHGDTDVFPFPFEKHLFEDKPGECLDVLERWHADFKDNLADNPPVTVDALCQVGYTGFRQVTEIEPFWNAYYLALVLRVAGRIEDLRIATDDNTVFSYRHASGDGSSLYQNVTWMHYRRRAVELAEGHEYVVLTDVADFYPRINHHRLENALQRVPAAGDIPWRLIRLLSTFSDGKSYGLPVGGPASRVLAELSLVDVDRSLRSAGTVFCRYADDFTLCCASRTDALKSLVDLAEALALEGLSLQKQKTRVMRKAEFLQMNAYLDPKPDGTMEQRLLSLSLKYDPYSPTAEEDYQALKASVVGIDIVGILSNEVAKTTIDPTLTRQALNALRALEPVQRERALSVLLAPENIHAFSPVFPHLMRIVRSTYDGLGATAKDAVDADLLALVDGRSHVLSVEINRLFLVQVLSRRHSQAKEKALVGMHGERGSDLLRRMIVHALANWDCGYFVKRLLPNFAASSPWERRALIVSSFRLGDQGSHWRKRTSAGFNDVERLLGDWAGERKRDERTIPV